jgi:cell division protein FtsZ
VGVAKGENRAVTGAEMAVSSARLDVTLDGAQGILFNVTSGPNLSLYEVNEAAEIVRRKAHPDANIIFGAVIDENLDEELRITLIATGFDAAEAKRRPTTVAGGVRKPQPQPRELDSKTIAFPQQKARDNSQPVAPREEAVASSMRQEPTYDPEDLEVPSFIRKRIQRRHVS